MDKWGRSDSPVEGEGGKKKVGKKFASQTFVFRGGKKLLEFAHHRSEADNHGEVRRVNQSLMSDRRQRAIVFEASVVDKQ